MSTNPAEIATAPIIHLPEIGSTNEEALSRVRRGEAGPLFVRADVQTAGRGRHGRSWTSPVGNLYMSLLLPVAAPASCLPQVAHVAAVALAQAVERLLGSAMPLRIKWPNDLLVGPAKAAGILVEGTRLGVDQVCVIGWGVNCASHPTDLPYAATDLTTAAGRPVEADALAETLRTAMAEAVALWDDGRGFEAVRSLWLAHAVPLGTPMRLRGDAMSRAGRFAGIDEAGRLVLQGPDGPVTIEAGEIILDENPAALTG